jgi:hypothetical protein
MTPVMIAIMASVLFLGAALFTVGSGASARANSQTAADAAALAAADAAREGLVQLAGDGTPPCGRVAEQAESAARDYAARNGGELRGLEIEASLEHGCVIDVWVRNGEAAASNGPLAPDVDEETARGGTTHARAASQGIPLFAGGGGAFGPDFDVSIDDPEAVAEAMVANADAIGAAGYPYVWGGGHGQQPVQPGGPGYDCSASVSMLLQQSGLNVPTMTSHGWVNADQSPAVERGQGDFLTVWAFTGDPGHVWVSIGGQGWGTHPGNAGGGPGWAHYATPLSHQTGAIPFHFPELEDGLDAGFIASLVPSSPSVWNGSVTLGSAGPRLLDTDA